MLIEVPEYTALRSALWVSLTLEHPQRREKCLNTLFGVVWCQVEKPDTTGNKTFWLLVRCLLQVRCWCRCAKTQTTAENHPNTVVLLIEVLKYIVWRSLVSGRKT